MSTVEKMHKAVELHIEIFGKLGRDEQYKVLRDAKPKVRTPLENLQRKLNLLRAQNEMMKGKVN